MIRVVAPLAPANYVADVRVPGHAFLARNPSPSRRDWDKHRYWSAIHPYLHGALKSICSYCATFTPKRSGNNGLDHTSIDHFVPKSKNHALAYEWTNFRLCRARLNQRKGDFEDVLDPYSIENGWFQLDFTTFAIFPNPALSDERKQKIHKSINRLGLNDDDSYVNERARAVCGYVDRNLLIADLARSHPFIAAEIVSQNFDAVHRPRIESALANPRLRDALVRQGVIT